MRCRGRHGHYVRPAGALPGAAEHYRLTDPRAGSSDRSPGPGVSPRTRCSSIRRRRGRGSPAPRAVACLRPRPRSPIVGLVPASMHLPASMARVRGRRCLRWPASRPSLPPRPPRRRAGQRDAKPVVITFDHHPDEVLTGTAPPLFSIRRSASNGWPLRRRGDRRPALRCSAAADALRRLRRPDPGRLVLKGFLMTPDAAFGFERQGTPETLATLGLREGFDVVVVRHSTSAAGRSRNSDIRTAIAAGDLRFATASLGGRHLHGVGGRRWPPPHRFRFSLPIALPPDGTYRADDGVDTLLEIRSGEATIRPRAQSRRVTVELLRAD